MRSFITASVLIASALAQSTGDYLKCATDTINSFDKSTFSSCDDKTEQECICANTATIKNIITTAIPSCSGLEIDSLATYICPSARVAAPLKHAGRPMQPIIEMRDATRRVIYVTQTRTDCSCKSSALAEKPMHVSQIPVNVPASSSMGLMVAASPTPVGYEHGLMVGAASSSMVFGPKGSGATPSAVPAGADATHFSPFEGAAAAGASVHGGVAVLGVAAVMAIMVAL
ncbi:uncharacterized protein N7479_008725 [Penicillium vulpinum]|uniref:Extracellular membrane protein CFEM domain-containing protein n=1 Tax=Penicillium vulpinum TaxID=29845 RepID=A0A1V6S1R7_9EURO|nr:uncharacterized protein N7479_008725 [Penicillium vulpinum]KAJ5950312.1 hypothetical protein N7479_008725 [Penicillium vulpinum]OQE07689.1 hypothetical protein PENVUL_c012G04261 [Penicillium vulpinum]